MVAVFWTNRTVKRAAVREEVLSRILIPAGAILLFGGFRRKDGVSGAAGWTMAALAAAGFAFTWWARLHLGRLWSGRVTRKADHRIVDRGPYAIVRHPIYAGIILAVLATGIAKGRYQAMIGALIMAVSFFIRARLEERFLSDELGAGAYDDYRRRVPILIPFGPRKR
jgi:protein-S-isoprenylcysteine O-methyltransferase Ste14